MSTLKIGDLNNARFAFPRVMEEIVTPSKEPGIERERMHLIPAGAATPIER